jgi:hypothetical protein
MVVVLLVNLKMVGITHKQTIQLGIMLPQHLRSVEIQRLFKVKYVMTALQMMPQMLDVLQTALESIRVGIALEGILLHRQPVANSVETDT